MLNSVVAAQLPHDFIYRGWEVQCPGNPLAHTILRGAVNKHGSNLPNYHFEDLRFLCDLYGARNLKNPACIADTNHSNSNKQYKEQIRIAKEVLHSRRHSHDIRTLVKGLLKNSPWTIIMKAQISIFDIKRHMICLQVFFRQVKPGMVRRGKDWQESSFKA